MANCHTRVNCASNFERADLETIFQPERLAANPFPPKQNGLKFGIQQIDNNLLHGGVLRGELLTIEVFDRFYVNTLCFYAYNMAKTDKKLAFVFSTEQFKGGIAQIQKYIKAVLPVEYQKNVVFFGTDAPPEKIFCELETENFDAIFLCNFWYRPKNTYAVQKLCDLVRNVKSAVIVFSKSSNPTWLPRIRTVTGLPAFATLDKYCYCNILMRPAFNKESHYADETRLKKTRDEIAKRTTAEVQAEILISQKDEIGNHFDERIAYKYSRGDISSPKTLLRFVFNESKTLFGNAKNGRQDTFARATLC